MVARKNRRKKIAAHAGPPREFSRQQYAVLGAQAAQLVTREWFEDHFEPAARLYMARLLFGLYASYQDGLLASKSQAMRYMRAIDGRTAQRYLALAETSGLIRISPSLVDKRMDLLCPTKKMLQLVERELADYGDTLTKGMSELQTGVDGGYETSEATLDVLQTQVVPLVGAVAVSRVEETQRLAPTNSRAYQRRGLCHIAVGEWDDALATFTKAIELDPLDATAYMRRTMVYAIAEIEDRDKYVELGLADLNKVIELAPRYALAYIFRARKLQYLGKLDDALSDLTSAIEVGNGEDRVRAYNFRADLHERLGNLPAAIADVEESLNLPLEKLSDEERLVLRERLIELKGKPKKKPPAAPTA